LPGSFTGGFVEGFYEGFPQSFTNYNSTLASIRLLPFVMTSSLVSAAKRISWGWMMAHVLPVKKWALAGNLQTSIFKS
jgi:hypothetical protein